MIMRSPFARFRLGRSLWAIAGFAIVLLLLVSFSFNGKGSDSVLWELNWFSDETVVLKKESDFEKLRSQVMIQKSEVIPLLMPLTIPD